MKQKRTFFSIYNVLTTLKAIVASVVMALILLIPSALAYWLLTSEMTQSISIVGRIIQGLVVLASLWIWGWLVNKFWKWS